MPDEDVPSEDQSPVADSAAEEGSADPSSDRRKLLRRMITGAAFAAPVVASFSMDGLGVAPSKAGAGVVPTSPWYNVGATRGIDPGGGFFPYLQTAGSYIEQNPNRNVTWLEPGALGVRFSFLLQSADISVHISIGPAGGGSIFDTTLTVSPSSFEQDLMFTSATTEQCSAYVRFTRTAVSGSSPQIDDVSVRGLYP